MIPDQINPRNHQPSVGCLGPFDRDAILAALRTLSIKGADQEALKAYADEDCERFMQTIHLLPQQGENILEIGANPYFTTILANWFRGDLKFTLTNFFEGQGDAGKDEIEITHPNGEVYKNAYSYDIVDIESGKLPYADESFDGVLFCEVIEHLTNDPQQALAEISRVLKPGGELILTTPNVARLENVARMMSGWNIYDPYSGYGPTGRHNREYTKHELHKLLTHCGFEVNALFTADVHENRAVDYYPQLTEITSLLEPRATDLGQYHFTRSIKVSQPSQIKQSWLYRSYPEAELDLEPL